MEPNIWVSAPCNALSVFGTKSLGTIRRVNTDYHHGDCPTGSFWCDVQIKTGDHEHPLVGRIRGWDGLIILVRQQVSPQPLISRLFFSTPFISYGFEPRLPIFPFFHLLFYFIFSLIEFADSSTFPLSSFHDIRLTLLNYVRCFLPTTTFSTIILCSTICSISFNLTSVHLVARYVAGARSDRLLRTNLRN